MLPLWAIIERDLRKYFRSPAILAASLLLPLLQLLIIGYAFGGKIQGVPVALVDLDRGPEAVRLREKFQAVEANARTFRVRSEESLDEALRLTREGVVGATIVIPEDYSRRVTQGNRPKLGLVLDNTDPFVVTTLTEKMGELLDAANRTVVEPRYLSRVNLEVVEIFPYVEYIQYLLPGIITLATFFCVLIGGGVLYIDDKIRGIHEAYLVSPITKLQLLLGMHVAGMIKGAFAGSVVTFVGVLLAGVGDVLTFSTILLVIGFTLLVSSSFVSLISLLMVRVDDPVVPRVVIGFLNTLLFFPSGAVYPTSSFPLWLQWIAKFDPFTYSVDGFRAVLLKRVGFTAIVDDVVILAVLSLVCFSGVLLLFQRRL
jgi:ABC-2 type transport system permease protein